MKPNISPTDLTLRKDLVLPKNGSILKFFEHCAKIAHKTLKDEYKDSMNIASRKTKNQ